MITGFSYNTRTGQWYADYEYNNKYSFKPIYRNSLGYFIKNGSKELYFTDEQEKQFKVTRKKTREQIKV